jgi:hypothetical protein
MLGLGHPARLDMGRGFGDAFPKFVGGLLRQ